MSTALESLREPSHFPLEQSNEGERLRIARDLHDYLGASLTEIGMLADRGAGDSEAGAAKQCRKIREQVNAALSELDALVWAVDPQQDTAISLVRYLVSFVEEFLGASGLECRLEVGREWPKKAVEPNVRRNIYLAVREAIHNAVRHANATRIIFGIDHAGPRLCIKVEDNGHGFDARARPGGHGLANLRARLSLIGGRCQVTSTPGRGTALFFSTPLFRGGGS